MVNDFYFWIYVFLSLFLIVFSFKVFRIWFNPLSIYSFIFLIAVIFNFFLPVYHPQALTWLILISSLLLFSFGSAGGAYWGDKKKIVLLSKKEGEKKYRILSLTSVVLSGIYILTFIYLNREIFVNLFSYGFNSFFYRAYNSYLTSQYRNFGYFEGVMPLLSLYVGVLDGLKRRLHKRTILFLIFISVFAFFTGLRTILFISLGIYASCYLLFLFKNRNPAKKQTFKKKKFSFLLVVILGLGVLMWITYGRAPFSGKDIGLKEASFKDLIFLEAGGHIARLSYFLEEKEQLSSARGALTFGPLMRSICRLSNSSEFCAEKFPHNPPQAPIPVTWMGGTYLMDLYADFGILGLIFGSFLLGWFSSFSWTQALKGDLFQLELASILLIFIIHSFRFSLTFAGNFFLMLILCILFNWGYKILNYCLDKYFA